MVDYTRGRYRHFPKNVFARGEKLTAGSVSLSDWLGGRHYNLNEKPPIIAKVLAGAGIGGPPFLGRFASLADDVV